MVGWRGGGEGKIYPGNRLHSSPKLLRLLNGDSSLGEGYGSRYFTAHTSDRIIGKRSRDQNRRLPLYYFPVLKVSPDSGLIFPNGLRLSMSGGDKIGSDYPLLPSSFLVSDNYICADKRSLSISRGIN